MSNVDDPVVFGLVASLASPGGNVTGLSATPGLGGLSGKRLELLKAGFPKVSRVAVLWNPNHPFALVFKRGRDYVEGPRGSGDRVTLPTVAWLHTVVAEALRASLDEIEREYRKTKESA